MIIYLRNTIDLHLHIYKQYHHDCYHDNNVATINHRTYYADTLVNVNHHSAVAVLNYILTYYAVHLEEQNYIDEKSSHQ